MTPAGPETLDHRQFVVPLPIAHPISEQLAEFVEALTWDAIPDAVRERATWHLLDTIGVAMAATASPSFARMAAALAEFEGAGPCSVFGLPYRLSPSNAALMNGMLAHALDWDDTHSPSVTHPSGVIVPTVIAVGERLGASPRDVLTAAIAGYEVTARLGMATAPGEWWRHGFHATSILGVFGAATAAGKLLSLSRAGHVAALGLAASQACGIQQYASPGEANDAKRFHSGWPAQCGIIAATLASAGLTAPLQVFEGVRSVFKTHLGRAAVDEAVITRDLGTHWETLNISVKIHPACQGFQASLEAIRAVRERLGSALASVESVTLDVGPNSLTLCEPVAAKRRPASHPAAVIAMQYCLGTMLAQGRLGISNFSPQALSDQMSLAFADKVHHALVEPSRGSPNAPKLSVRLQDGTVLEEEVLPYRGSPQNPLDAAGYRAKFMLATEALPNDGRRDVLADAVLGLEYTAAATFYTALRQCVITASGAGAPITAP